MSVNRESQFSGNIKFLSFLLAVPIGFMAYFSYVKHNPSVKSNFNPSKLASRGPASVNSEQADFQALAAFKNRSKPTAFSMQLTANNEEFLQVDDQFTVSATIKPSIPVGEAKFRWILPEGLEVIASDLEGELGDLVPGQDMNIQIELQNKSLSNKIIHLEVYSDAMSVKFLNISSFTTNSNIDKGAKALNTKKLYKIPEGSKMFQ